MCQLLSGANNLQLQIIKQNQNFFHQTLLRNFKTPPAITGLEQELLSRMGLLKCGVALTLAGNSLCVVTQEFSRKHQVYFHVSTVLSGQQEIKT